MALAKAVQGGKRPGQTITWTDEDGDALDLTGATLTGFIRNLRTGQTRAIDGTLTVTGASSGVFTWAYGTNDVSEAGVDIFEVQFVATYSTGVTPAKSKPASWTVYDGLSV